MFIPGHQQVKIAEDCERFALNAKRKYLIFLKQALFKEFINGIWRKKAIVGKLSA